MDVSTELPAYVDENGLYDCHEDDGEGPRNVHLIRVLLVLRVVPRRVYDVVDEDGDKVDDERDEMCLYHLQQSYTLDLLFQDRH